MKDLKIPVDLIWGEKDPWEPIAEAKRWQSTISCISSMNVIAQAGHCVHDEAPMEVNAVLAKITKNQLFNNQQAT
jgi:pimeloyl-ACP methyl ester carboxylesterase